jgi:hypothetical protein
MGQNRGPKLMTLDEIVAGLTPSGSGEFAIDLPDNWSQGRTAYGGITAALGLASARAAFDNLPPLRSAQVAFVGPLGGWMALVPTLLRRGRTASFVQVVASSGANVGAVVTFVFAADRESAVSIPIPDTPVATGEALQVPEQVRFAQNFDHWFAGADSNYVDRFIRLKSPSAVDPEIELLAVADLLPPPALFNMPEIVPLSSMSWQIDLMAPARRSADGRWRLRNEAEMHDRGLSTQLMWMWDGDGRQVASGRQLVTLFG